MSLKYTKAIALFLIINLVCADVVNSGIPTPGGKVTPTDAMPVNLPGNQFVLGKENL